MASDCTSRWVPLTQGDREEVLRELGVILPSSHFRNSKRYPALLDYLVRKALDGETAHLKERTLGIEVFGRSPQYDTSEDPVVRVAAAEIRKRIAQFYHESGGVSSLQIELPLGSYVPEFRRVLDTPVTLPPQQTAEGALALQDPLARVPVSVRERVLSFFRRKYILTFSAILALVTCLAVFGLGRVIAGSASDQFWKPLLKTATPVIVVVPTSLHNPEPTAIQNGVDLVKLAHGPYNRISVSDAIAVSRFASVLGKYAKPFAVKEADLTSLSDLHERSVILVGAINNHWTMRLTEGLRFHFVQEPALVRIADSQYPKNREWMVDYAKPYAYAQHDYAIIAHYNDATTRGDILIIAGIGAHATQAASEFVSSPAEIEQIRRMAPAGWEHKNMEMVIATNVINGDSGPPQLVAVTTW